MPTTSTYPEIDIPKTDIWTFLFERKDRPFPDDKVIFVDCDTQRSYTYAQTRQTAIDFAKGLKASWEWKKGDVIALYTPNDIDVPVILWGTHWAGGIVTPANPAYRVEELTFQLKNSGAKALVTHKDCLDVARKACKNAGIPEDRIILLGDGRDDTAKFKHFTSVRNMAGTSRFRRAKPKNPEDELAFIVYSSGTTGLPKGVMLSHYNIIANILQLGAGETDLTWNGNADGKGDRLLGFLPFYHIYGLTCLIHNVFYKGLEMHVMPKFGLERLCQVIQDKKLTFAYLVPPVVLQLAKNDVVSKYDLSSLRMINSGAAPLTKELVDAFWNRLQIPIKQGYGLSETSPTTHTQPWAEWYSSLGSVGKMLPNMTAKYVDTDGETEVAAGQPGELWIKGPNIFKGYLKNPEGTANAMSADGYFKTGDVGYIDKDGNFFITDRVKELIKYKGFQVPPAELEGLLNAHPKVYDVAVLGVYDREQATEVPRAYITLHQGHEKSEATAREIADWMAGQVAPHKKLRGGVRFIDQIPKTPTGKILRRILKEHAKNEGEGPKAKL